MNKLNHLAIIMDGNRRWAKKRGLPTLEGHRRGYEKLKQVGDWCIENGIKFLTVYAFSTENWKRNRYEIKYLMDLTLKALTDDLEEFNKKGIRMMTVGQLHKYPKKIREAYKTAVEVTKNNKKGTLITCLNYGGRLEIVDAVKKIIQQEKKSSQINEKLIQNNLYAPDIPAPDLIFRAGGEMRLSNFLTWQSIYSELYFSKTLWPDFSRREFDTMLKEYDNRQRKFGK